MEKFGGSIIFSVTVKYIIFITVLVKHGVHSLPWTVIWFQALYSLKIQADCYEKLGHLNMQKYKNQLLKLFTLYIDTLV